MVVPGNGEDAHTANGNGHMYPSLEGVNESAEGRDQFPSSSLMPASSPRVPRVSSRNLYDDEVDDPELETKSLVSNMSNIQTRSPRDARSSIIHSNRRGSSRRRRSLVSATTAKTRPPSPLPWSKLFVLCMVQITEGVMLSQVAPYLPFYIERLIDATDSTDPRIGTFTGLLIATFSLAQFLSAYPWGLLSDKIGRRPVLLAGIFGSFVIIPMFGLSTELWHAFLTRALAGLMNGNIPVAKTYLSEILDETNQAKGFAVFMVNFSLGLVIGPTIGGALYGVGGGIFDDYPALLPCLISSSFSICGLILALFSLDETLPNPTSCWKSSKKESDDYSTLKGGPTPSMRDPNSSRHDPMHEVLVNATRADSDPDMEEDQEPGQLKNMVDDTRSAYGSTISDVVKNGREGTRAESDPSTKLTALQQLWGNRTYIICLINFAIGSTVFVMIGTVFPLWAKVDETDGGWQWDTDLIGYIQTSAAGSVLLMNLFFFHLFAKWMGYLRMFRFFWFFPIVGYFLWPLLGELKDYDQRIGLMVVFQVFTYGGGVVTFTIINILVVNSVNREILGTANGLVQSFAALARSAGPSVAGAGFSEMLRYELDGGYGSNLPFLNQYLVMYLCSFLAFISVVLSFWIPSKYNKPKPPKMKDDLRKATMLTDVSHVR